MEQRTMAEAAADAVVALDGSGGYTTIADALKDVPRSSTKRFTIYIKKGVYKVTEPIVVADKVWNLTLAGDGIDVTVISGDRSNADGYDTYQTGTLSVKGRGFIAHDLSIENTAGAAKHQAVAFMSESDKSVVYRCAFIGHQDTLYAKKNKQFYSDCRIEGTVDFVFGNAFAVFQNCRIIARLPLKFCDVSAANELVAADPLVTTYLGRPWKNFSRVIFMQCSMSKVVDPKGWLKWNDKPNVSSLFYGEYKNVGAGADVSRRVNWPGYHVIQNVSEASNYTVERFIDGNEWLPSTGVDYTPGLEL